VLSPQLIKIVSGFLFTQSFKQVMSLVYISQLRTTSRKEGKSCVEWNYGNISFAFPKKNITSGPGIGDSLQECSLSSSYLINIEEGLHSFKIVDGGEKCKYSAKWEWHLIIHGINTIKWKLKNID
jgi:hypothetical protein